jgi:hypothetical protein
VTSCLCLSVYLSVPPIAARQQGLFSDERRDRPCSVGALTEQSSDLLPLRQRLNIIRVRVTLRLAVYRQSVCLVVKLLETYDQSFYFPTERLRLHSLCNILSDERMGLSFIIAPGLRQRSHSQVRVHRDS